MSADNALIYVDNIRDALVKYDPPHADTYRRNAEAYKEKIRQTMAPLQARLAQLPADKRWLVTSEGAFSYLARDYGLRELYLWPINRRPAGHPATGAQGYRHHEERTHPDHLQRKHHLR